jgi:glucose/arabinose dehydrogenase
VLQDGYLIAGTIGSSSSPQQAYIVKLKRDIFAAPEFTRKFTVNYSTAVSSITTYSGGNFLIGGYVNINPGLRMLVAEIDKDGNLVEGKTMIKGSTGDQTVNDVVSGDDGYIIALGRNTYEVNSMISFLKFRF